MRDIQARLAVRIKRQSYEGAKRRGTYALARRRLPMNDGDVISLSAWSMDSLLPVTMSNPLVQ